jgi:hypothetical protein
MEAAQTMKNENDCQTIEHDIASGRLYKTYLLCPDIEKYIQIDDLSTVTCQPGFLEQLDKSLDQQSIFFYEENPREKHQFATPSTVMVTLLVPPNFILCVDGILSLKRGQLTKAHVLGIYLFRDSDQFFNNSEFDMAFLHNNS